MKVLFTTACIVMLIMCVSAISSGGEIIYSQNFDNLKDGDMDGQDGWELITSLAAGIGSPTVQNDVALEGKALQVEAVQEVYKLWPKPVNTGTCYLSIFFRKENAGDGNTLHIYMGKGALAWSAGPVIRIGSQSGGALDDIGVHDGSDNVRVQPAKYKVGEWHHLREVIDVDKQTFDLYLDEKKLGNYEFRNASHDTIEWLMIGFDAGTGLLGYYDAIEFGLGTGESAFARAKQIEPTGKLSVTWGNIKAVRE